MNAWLTLSYWTLSCLKNKPAYITSHFLPLALGLFFLTPSVGELRTTFAAESSEEPLKANLLKKWRICVCAVVENEAAYLPEWIEFHRLQGADHFAIYDLDSVDLVQYLPLWYELAELKHTLKVYPARFVPAGQKNRNDRNVRKRFAMYDCYMRHQKMAEWIIILDSNRFIYSPSKPSVWDVLRHLKSESKNEPVSAVRVSSVTFGPPGKETKGFRNWVTPNRDTGFADFLYEPMPLSKFPLVITANTKRAPHRKMDANYKEFASCEPWEGFPCNQSPLITIIKSGRCDAENIMLCVRPDNYVAWEDVVSEDLGNGTAGADVSLENQETGTAASNDIPTVPEVYNARLDELRVNFYPIRPINFIHPPKGKKRKENATETPSWFSAVFDPFGLTYEKRIRRAVQKLRPRPFIQVGRECVPQALESRQQMECPPTHPYPYGSDADLIYLRNCCKTDRDYWGRNLSSASYNCENDAKVACVEPKTIVHWVHRSCCINTRNGK